MPCDTITTVQVSEELKDINIDILEAALKAMGFQTGMSKSRTTLAFKGTESETGNYFSGTYTNGKLTTIQNAFDPKLDINHVKVSYSHAVVQKSALAYGWKLQKTSKHGYIAQKG